AQNLSGAALTIVRLNPVFYVVEGYRNALLYQQPLSAMWPLDVYFWAVTLGLFFFGALVFTRLKPHFADVLGAMFLMRRAAGADGDAGSFTVHAGPLGPGGGRVLPFFAR